MAFSADSMSPADFAAMTGNGSNNAWGGDGSFWIIVLFLIMALGFGNGSGFGGGSNAVAPYAITSDVQRGFDQSALTNSISSVSNGVAGLQTALCNGFAGVNSAISSGFATAEVADNARQIANMQQAFNTQTAITAGQNALAAQLANCCCENRLATANLNSTILSENCADRAALSDGIRDVVANQTANTQSLLNAINGGIQSIQDKLCAQEIDALKTQNANLQTQLQMANLSASQTAQTAKLLADNAAQTTAIEQYLNPTPRPAYVVPSPYGYNYGCGCGMM